jgi:hypothetical protein
MRGTLRCHGRCLVEVGRSHGRALLWVEEVGIADAFALVCGSFRHQDRDQGSHVRSAGETAWASVQECHMSTSVILEVPPPGVLGSPRASGEARHRRSPATRRNGPLYRCRVAADLGPMSEPTERAHFFLTDGWSVVPIETVEQLRAEDLVDLEPSEYLRFEQGLGLHYWALRDGQGHGHAIVGIDGRLVAPAVSIFDVWVDECSDSDVVDARVREWFDQLRQDGYALSRTNEDYSEDQVQTIRELLHLCDSFVSCPQEWLGGIDDRWQVECHPHVPPMFEWDVLAAGMLFELRSPWWRADELPEEQYGRAWFTFALLDRETNVDEGVRNLRDKAELAFDEELEEMVVMQLYDELGDEFDTLESVADHPRYLELCNELAGRCVATRGFERPFNLARYLEDLLELVPAQLDSLREPLPNLEEARTRVEQVERAATWKPTATPSSRISGLAS